MSWLNERRPYNPFSAFGPHGASVNYYVSPPKPKNSSDPQPSSSKTTPKAPHPKRSETPVSRPKTKHKFTKSPVKQKLQTHPKRLPQKDKPKQRPSVSIKASKLPPKTRTDSTKQQLGSKRAIKPAKKQSDTTHSKDAITKHNFI